MADGMAGASQSAPSPPRLACHARCHEGGCGGWRRYRTDPAHTPLTELAHRPYRRLMQFEWNEDKDRSNRAKHGIGFQEAIEVFEHPNDAFERFDEHHSVFEDRFITIGPIRRGLVLVVWTARVDDIIRVISARFATPTEQRLYRNHREHRR